MRVGDYVRTNYGTISKLEAIDEDIILGNKGYLDKENIIKTSPNIIDLIEEHDILKIEEQKGVYTICEVEEFRDPYVNYKFLGVRLENQSRVRKLYELNIKSIVTKEQFKSMEYRMGE